MKLFRIDHGLFKLVGCLLFFLLILPSPKLHALESMNEEEMSEVGAAEGFAIDIDLNAIIDDLTFTDGDGNSSGNAGVIQLGSGTNGFTLDNGAGGTANLNGLTIDADQNALSDNSGAVVIGGPSGTLTMSADEVILGGGGSAFQLDVNGIDVSNTTVKVGAN
jgi:hypothetical protein